MSKRHITQFRFFGDENSVFNTKDEDAIYHLMDNNTDGITMSDLISGDAFKNHYPIIQLGIQSLPGLRFTINSNFDPIIIGATGIYELDLHEKSVISALHFDPESIKTIKQSLTTGNGFLIVDIVYEEGEEQHGRFLWKYKKLYK